MAETQLSRREIFSLAIGAAVTPWQSRADQLWDEHGHYADFEAWLEWFNAKAAKLEFADIDIGGTMEQIALYSIMCDLFKDGRMPKRGAK